MVFERPATDGNFSAGSLSTTQEFSNSTALAAPAPKSDEKYSIKDGDTLSEIALSHLQDGATIHDIYNYVEQIARYNHIKNPNKIYAGKDLYIPPFEHSQAGHKAARPVEKAAPGQTSAESSQQLLTVPPDTENNLLQFTGAGNLNKQIEPVTLPEAAEKQAEPLVNAPAVEAEHKTESPAPMAPKENGPISSFRPNVLARAGHLGNLALQGAGDYAMEHPYKVALETAGGFAAGALMRKLPVKAAYAAGALGLGALGYDVNQKYRQLAPAVGRIWNQDANVSPADLNAAEATVRQGLGEALIDTAAVGAGGALGASEKLLFRRAAATAIDTASTGVEATSAERITAEMPLAESEIVSSDAQSLKARPASLSKFQAADSGAGQSTGTKYVNPDGNFRQEDSLWMSSDNKVMLVADGAGGHEAGDVASRIAAEVVQSEYQKFPHQGSDNDVVAWMENALRNASNEIKNNSDAGAAGYLTADGGRLIGKPGMVSTAVASAMHNDKMIISWAGDSRAYRLRAGQLEQLTADHSPAILADGTANDGSVISSALGMDRPRIDTVRADIQPGDRFLLASDGLETLTPDQIAAVLARPGSAREASRHLTEAVSAANAQKQDNLTVIVFDPKMH